MSLRQVLITLLKGHALKIFPIFISAIFSLFFSAFSESGDIHSGPNHTYACFRLELNKAKYFRLHKRFRFPLNFPYYCQQIGHAIIVWK